MRLSNKVVVVCALTAALSWAAAPAWATTFTSVSGVYAETADAGGEIWLDLKDNKCDAHDVYFKMKDYSGVFSTTRNSKGCGKWVHNQVAFGPSRPVYGRACVDAWRDSCTSWLRLA